MFALYQRRRIVGYTLLTTYSGGSEELLSRSSSSFSSVPTENLWDRHFCFSVLYVKLAVNRTNLWASAFQFLSTLHEVSCEPCQQKCLAVFLALWVA